MRTIGHHWPKDAPRGDFQALCDYCGCQWRRSQLYRDRAGLLVCPDEGRGKDAVTLDRENQASSQNRLHTDRRYDRGANLDLDGGLKLPTPITPWSIFATDPDDGYDQSSLSLQETDLEFWLDMSDTRLDVLGRMTLVDRSYASHVFSQDSSSLQPAQTGQSLTFDGGDRLVCAGNKAATEYLHNGTGGIAVLFTPANISATQSLVSTFVTATDGGVMGISASLGLYQVFAQGVQALSHAAPITISQSQWWLGAWEDGASPETVLYRDGTLVASGPSATGPSPAPSTDLMTIGARFDGSNPYTGSIRAIVGFKGGIPSSQQLTDLGTYFDSLS